MPAELREELVTIQHDLFDLGGELCIPGYQMITEDHVLRLDAHLAKYNATLPALTEFILPAGSRAASQAISAGRKAYSRRRKRHRPHA
jgi:cob(I)alamin adenosyltransferase